MSKSPSPSNFTDSTDTEAERHATTNIPRWVKVFLIVSVTLLLVFVVFHLSGGGFGRHGV